LSLKKKREGDDFFSLFFSYVTYTTYLVAAHMKKRELFFSLSLLSNSKKKSGKINKRKLKKTMEVDAE
jgi:hypothetical protein